jgi:ABC-2 type transport system permease protein
MTTVTDTIATGAVRVRGEVMQARPAGFTHDLATIAGRALRAVPRDPAAVIPPVFIALFFFVVNIATLKKLTGHHPGFSYTAFEMATAILLGVTGISRAPSLVLDIQTHYLDRLLLTPVRRTAILLGHMTADVAVAAALTAPIMILGAVLGVRFGGGVPGIVAFVVLASLWSLAFAGFGYAIALKTGNPAAVNSMFLLFFPFLFLTSSYVPRSQLSGWLSTVAGFNPVTYLLGGLRSLVLDPGWQWGQLAQAVAAISVVGLVSMTMCFAALRGRVKQNASA